MSSDERNEVTIIRRRRDDGDEDHHGGVWKLAFADFMTAMMAFFLVMWLINSTSKETKAAIVQYFNPVQLVDGKPAKKGLRDPKDSGQGASVQQTQESKETHAGADAAEVEAAALHKEPIKTLDTIARLDLPKAATPSLSTDALADPFDRMDSGETPDAGVQQTPAPKSAKRDKSDAAAQPTPPPSSNAPKNDPGAAIASALDAAVKTEAQGLSGAPKVDVKRVDEGLLISLTDDVKFSMFDVGSIRPKPQLVRILQKIGATLTKMPGNVEIAGHTDGRAYKSGYYDNWRLSSDRANVVLYMLARGGLPPARVTRISGFADRRLKMPNDPLAPVNRRIEILVRGDRN
jgi:chemotaxis protein MotB